MSSLISLSHCWCSVESPTQHWDHPRYQLFPLIQKLEKPILKTASRTRGPNPVCLALRQDHTLNQSFLLQESTKHSGGISISSLLVEIRSGCSTSDKLRGQASSALLRTGRFDDQALSKSDCFVEAYLHINVWCLPTSTQAWRSHTA